MIHCSDCAYWDGFGNGRGGQCRRHAPVLVIEQLRDGYGNPCTQTYNQFPTTGETDWCGDAKAIDHPEPREVDGQ